MSSDKAIGERERGNNQPRSRHALPVLCVYLLAESDYLTYISLPYYERFNTTGLSLATVCYSPSDRNNWPNSFFLFGRADLSNRGKVVKKRRRE